MRSILAILSIFISVQAPAFELSLELVSPNCPFVHQDEFRFDNLLGNLKTQLEAKDNHRRECLGGYNELIANLDTVNELYSYNNNEALRQEITIEVYEQAIADMQTQVMLMELSQDFDPSSPAYQGLLARLGVFEDIVFTTEINRMFNVSFDEESQDIFFRQRTLNHLNETFYTLAQMPSTCVNEIGGWRVVVPTLFSMAGMASGLSGLSARPLLGSVMQTFANFSLLLQNRGLREAIGEMEANQTQKVLACTYNSIKTAACEYNRAYKLSQDKRVIENIIKQKYDNSEVGEYQRYFYILGQIDVVKEVFNDISSMGSAFTLDLTTLFEYFVAKRTRPKTIDMDIPNRVGTANPPTKDEMSRWLRAVRRQGISFSDRDETGVVKELEERVAAAEADIEKKIQDIDIAEQILTENRSFVDLRHEILKESDSQLAFITRLFHYLKTVRDKPDFEEKEIINATVNMLEKLLDFLSVKQTTNNYQDYVKDVNLIGAEFFNVMAEGSVAQLSEQTVLSVGPIAVERFNRAFKAIENYYLDKDIKNSSDPAYVKFSSYKRDNEIRSRSLEHLKFFSGSGKSFRKEDIDTAQYSFVTGFEREIKRSLEKAIDSGSSIIESHDGETARNLCALYNDIITRDKSFKSIKKWCLENAKELELINNISNEKVAIDYSNACFYNDYQRRLREERLILEAQEEYWLKKSGEAFFNESDIERPVRVCSQEQVNQGCYSIASPESCHCPQGRNAFAPNTIDVLKSTDSLRELID